MTMVVESLAVIVIILLFSYLSWRRGAKKAARLALPLVAVPLFHLALTPLASFIAGYFSQIGTRLMAAFIDMLGLVIACALFGVFAAAIPSKRGRRSYLWLSCGFSFILSLVFIHSILGPVSTV